MHDLAKQQEFDPRHHLEESNETGWTVKSEASVNFFVNTEQTHQQFS